MTKEFLDGRDAHAFGIMRAKCPYPKNTEAGEDWRDGWDDADAAAHVTDIDQQEDE